MTMRVTSLFVYPIKSCRGISLDRAEATPTGFAWDREFMLVDQKGKFISQRQYAQLARIQVQLQNDALVLSVEDSDLPAFTLNPTLSGTQLEVDIWRDRTVAIDQGNEVANWFEKSLQLTGVQLRLVRQSPDYPRLVDPDYATRQSDRVSFADAFPFLLTTSASLADLNQRLAKAYPNAPKSVPMNRFRPNIVVETEVPFAEDRWQVVQIGNLVFDIAKSCARCLVTTTDQFSGERDADKEPLKILSQFRQAPQSREILFGRNLIAQTAGTLEVGAAVTVQAIS